MSRCFRLSAASSGEHVIRHEISDISCWSVSTHHISTTTVACFRSGHSQLFATFPHHLGKVASPSLPSTTSEIVIFYFLVPERKWEWNHLLKREFKELSCTLQMTWNFRWEDSWKITSLAIPLKTSSVNAQMALSQNIHISNLLAFSYYESIVNLMYDDKEFRQNVFRLYLSMLPVFISITLDRVNITIST